MARERPEEGAGVKLTVLYDELDPFAVAWLRELVKGGHIAAGEVIETSIEDLEPHRLAGLSQLIVAPLEEMAA